ncbi:zinc finger CCHC domain-containing protein 8-like [Acipenser oxyrinchus oxyrinchus]|uniref:Zinc finger CCHC domain-containing protein 8 n=1 Tax=Acipenser oxyrinchus oxyrinchus TaxID=40147 RepID=A0AAD8FUJ3_ACIOX|nr:zinc finger CCHC domain-containing protein 8-like [Acipenser oxyrinchus oxyrinchus]
MAEVDFGGSELFQQLDEDKPAATHIRFEDARESEDERRGLRERLEECEETVARLKEENILSRRNGTQQTSQQGLHKTRMEESRLDGPLLQILFTNNAISKQYHQEIEDCIFSLVQKYQEQSKNDTEKASFDVKPQPSSFILEENHKVKTANTVKKIKDAFSVVGSVLYFTNFCLDKLGQPLLSENPQLTDGWEIPKYQQVFSQVISVDGQEVQIKDKRPKPCCFNCGSDLHQLKDCPKPRDFARISEKRKELSQNSNQNSYQRYHADEERFGKYKAGTISEELQTALGIPENSLPPFIYRMRQLGYPPGWLKEAEMENSGLALYDGKDDGGMDKDKNDQSRQVSYDVSKLIDFPGFNVPAPKRMLDEWSSYNSIPMQHNHLKECFATYLSSNYPEPGSSSNKRAYESDSTPCNPKKRRSDINETVMCLDMDVDSGSETPHSSQGYDNFRFQPPLPPGSPAMSTLPPLPRGTPPGTPPNFVPPPPLTPTPPPLPKGTPPRTPTSGSPAVQPHVVDDSTDADALTLEELEEQQRLIWAALENSETTTNSDSETLADTPLTGTSQTSSPSNNDTEAVAREAGELKLEAADTTANNGDKELEKPVPAVESISSVVADSTSNSTDNDEVPMEIKEAPVCIGTSESPSSSTALEAGNRTDEEARDGSEIVGFVPHRSNFAAGITPFEDTGEYTNVAKTTGVYLKLRDLLKSSPRNQTKAKN